MDSAKINEIIATENADREQEAISEARAIIRSIAACTERISEEQAKIATLRENLKKLSIQTVDAAAILG
jgi:hypothetical protein